MGKISEGFSIHEAAEQLGIGLDEAVKIATETLEKRDLVSFELKLIAEKSLQVSLKKLMDIAEGDQRISSQSVGKLESTSYNSDDLEAAKALAKLAIDALKLGFAPPKVTVKTGKGSNVQMDLFDVTGPWKLKTPGT